MTLRSILAQYNLVQSRIDALLHAPDATAADMSFLARQSRELREQIITDDPTDRWEAAQKLGCLINLLQRELMLQGIDREFSMMLRSASEACDKLLTEDKATPPPREEVSSDPDTPKRPSGSAIFGGSIADYVSFAEGRVSLIGTDYTYIATSAENAKFYGRSPVSLMGAHMADFIGDLRFETRTKARLDACFSGEPQSYHHALNCGGEAKIMRCDMKPVNSSDGNILGALVYLTDVTEQVRKLRPSSEHIANQFIRRG